MASLYAVIAEVAIRVVGYIFQKHSVNQETKHNFHQFVESWQKSNSSPVAHHDNDEDILKQIKEDENKLRE